MYSLEPQSQCGEDGIKKYMLPDCFDTEIFKTFKQAAEITDVPLKTIYKWTNRKKINISRVKISIKS